MIFSRDYSRAILNLKDGEGSLSQGKGVFGRAVVEVKGGRGQIMIFARGVKPGCICSLYIICRKGRGFVPLKAVLVNTKNALAEVKWDFNPDNILGSGFKLEEAAALAVLTDKGERVVAAFFDKPFDFGEVHTAEVNRPKPKPAVKAEDTPKPKAEPEKKAEEAEKISPDKEEKEEKPKSSDNEKNISQTYNTGFDFTEVVNRFSKDIDELRRFAYMQKMDFEAEESKAKRDRRSLSAEGILEDRDSFKLKDRDGSEGDFCKISLNELCLLDPRMYKYQNNPTFIRCFNKYGHLILSKREDSFVLGLPDIERDFKDSEALGFRSFVLTKPGFGYRIMKINN
ncbi:MAG: hypothetical protein LUG66_07735 [Clostridiales bacterium]|nr:hypothetical protein [Clostridiales bacterium]